MKCCLGCMNNMRHDIVFDRNNKFSVKSAFDGKTTHFTLNVLKAYKYCAIIIKIIKYQGELLCTM